MVPIGPGVATAGRVAYDATPLAPPTLEKARRPSPGGIFPGGDVPTVGQLEVHRPIRHRDPPKARNMRDLLTDRRIREEVDLPHQTAGVIDRHRVLHGRALE